jgi:hypothetical protein
MFESDTWLISISGNPALDSLLRVRIREGSRNAGRLRIHVTSRYLRNLALKGDFRGCKGPPLLQDAEGHP